MKEKQEHLWYLSKLDPRGVPAVPYWFDSSGSALEFAGKIRKIYPHLSRMMVVRCLNCLHGYETNAALYIFESSVDSTLRIGPRVAQNLETKADMKQMGLYAYHKLHKFPG